jgi:hypothetical protein
VAAERHLTERQDVRRVEALWLSRALRYTLALSDRWDVNYEAAARQFLVRILVEVRPPLIQAKRLADAMAYVRHGYYGPFARAALEDVVRQLERRQAGLDVKFNSLQN